MQAFTGYQMFFSIVLLSGQVKADNRIKGLVSKTAGVLHRVGVGGGGGYVKLFCLDS